MFSVRLDGEPRTVISLGRRYLEVKELLGSYHYISPFDMYEALTEANSDIR